MTGGMGTIPVTPTRCIACRGYRQQPGEMLMDMMWQEPVSGTDSNAVYCRGWICGDCAVTHWASRADAWVAVTFCADTDSWKP